MKKLPIALAVPLGIMQAPDPGKMGFGEDGLEMVQVVSVGRKPVP
jgi:hypothetical protein